MTIDQLKVKISQFIAVGTALASITPTALDDDAVEFVRYLTQDTDAVARAWELFQNARVAQEQNGGR